MLIKSQITLNTQAAVPALIKEMFYIFSLPKMSHQINESKIKSTFFTLRGRATDTSRGRNISKTNPLSSIKPGSPRAEPLDNTRHTKSLVYDSSLDTR